MRFTTKARRNGILVRTWLPGRCGGGARARPRARSIFGAARAAELAGDRKAAAEGYREYLKLMEKGDGRRAELAVARGR